MYFFCTLSKNKKKLYLILLLLFAFATVFTAKGLTTVSAQEQHEAVLRFPRMQVLQFSDSVFKQYSQEVSENYKLLAKQEDAITTIYMYTASENDNLLAIAARCNIPYETIASLNGIAFIDSVITGKTLLIPTSSGLFIPEKPNTPLEFLLKTRYSDNREFGAFQIGNNVYNYIPGAKLSPTERAFFTDSSMIPPLETGVISSSFGTRISPFTGEQSFHQGTDIAAPIGTPVYASKSGMVSYSGVDNIYGNYIIIQHDNNTQSLYAHLDEYFVFSGEIIEKGTNIGTVGNTGLSTGPHLHFEIRIARRAQDPASLIRNFLQ